jgi:hypothetical protein
MKRNVWIVAGVVFALSLSVYFTPAHADTAFSAPLCGNGSAPDYGFTYDLQQAHWTVGGQGYVSEQAMSEADAILDQLNGDSIAQTMILILPQNQVGNRVNCAVHFLRYMQLGLPTGTRKDNGFVFLIVVEAARLDVHYGVGLGLPALTAPELTTLNRAAEDIYQTTHSADQALLTLVQKFDAVARNKYPPLISPTPIPAEPITLPSGPLGILTVCGLLCLALPLFFILMWMFNKLARSGVTFNSPGLGSWRGGGSFGGGRSSPPTRGGSGSGRSGRGN